MKKLNYFKKPHQLRAAKKRFKRSNRVALALKNGGLAVLKRRRRRSSSRGHVEAPAKLDLYSAKNHFSFIAFLENLRKSVKQNSSTFISFRSSTRITAAAALMLVAETDRLKKAFPDKKIRCSTPEQKTKNKFNNDQNLVESALKQIGFFTLIGQKNNCAITADSVKKWKQNSGDTADGSLARSLLNTLGDIVSDAARKKMYRGAIEAIANCVEHAYPNPRSDGFNIDDKRWWMLAGIDESNLCVIVCDLGVGIPMTLPVKHSPGILTAIKSTFGILNDTDSELIRASTHIRQTRTKLKNRGKGGKDFRSITKNFPTATLSIRSNRGAFFMTGPNRPPLSPASGGRYVAGTDRSEMTRDHKKSIRGTMMEWTVPLQDLAK